MFLHGGTLALGLEDAVLESLVLLEDDEALLCRRLLALLLGVAPSTATFQSFYHHHGVENVSPVLVGGLVQVLEVKANAVLLAPFQQFALEVHLLVGHLVHVDDVVEDALLHELHAAFVAKVQVDGTHESLEGIAGHVAVVTVVLLLVGLDEAVQANLHGQLAQRLALNQLAAGIGEEPLTLVFKMTVHHVAHYGIQDGIAQKLHTFVVLVPSVLALYRHGLVKECLFIVGDILGVETQDVI